MKKAYWILSLILIATLSTACALTPKPAPQPTASQSKTIAAEWNLHQLLQESWDFYKGRFLVDGAHVVSNSYGGTISEGQSYALLKSVWMNDPATFRKVWTWTKSHMKRPHDHLLGWRWGDGQFGTRLGLMETDNATDADQDIAYALLLAGKQWNEPSFTADGLAIVQDLWRLNVQEIDGRYYLVPGTWQGFRQEYLSLDPSYMAPYVYRHFARYDKAHAAGWTQLADDTYDTLEACTALTKPQVPPNWCAVKWQDDHKSPRIIFSDRQGAGARDFSYDAFRVYWRMAMDSKLSPAPGQDRARRYLETHQFLRQYWAKNHLMPEGFTADGAPRYPTGRPENSGFAMGSVLVLNHFAPTLPNLSPDSRRTFKVPVIKQSFSQNLSDAALYRQMLGPYYHAEGYWFNDYNDFLHSVIWLHLYSLSL